MLARWGFSSRPRSAWTLLLRGLRPLPHAAVPAIVGAHLDSSGQARPGRVCAAFSALARPWLLSGLLRACPAAFSRPVKAFSAGMAPGHWLPIVCRQEKRSPEDAVHSRGRCDGPCGVGLPGGGCRNHLLDGAPAPQWPCTAGNRPCHHRRGVRGPGHAAVAAAARGGLRDQPGEALWHCLGADGPMHCCAAAWTCMMN